MKTSDSIILKIENMKDMKYYSIVLRYPNTNLKFN